MNKIVHRKVSHSNKISSSPCERERRDYYWIWFDRDGEHKGLWGAYNSYEEAERKAVSKLNVPYEIVKLSTRDESEASRRLRANLLNDTGNVEQTFNRFSHKEE